MNTETQSPAKRGPRAGTSRRRASTKPLHPDSALIDRLGGTMAAAEFFEVKGGSVSPWRYTGIPRARMMYLRAVRPDLFDTDAATPHETAPQDVAT